MPAFDECLIRHRCGLFGVFGHPDAVALTHLGLFALQHRGQESAGICSTDGGRIVRAAGTGLVNQVFNLRTLEDIQNPIAIGHVRYSTMGSCVDDNAQPLLFEHAGGQVAIAHNGNLINAALLRHQYEEHGSIFRTTCDTEVIVHLLAKQSHQRKPDPLSHALNQLQGAYSLLLLCPDRIIAVRDPLGFRPLCLGRMGDGAYVVASETCALDIVDAEYERDVDPGEIVTISQQGVSSRRFGGDPGERGAACIFEHVYFADPSSNIFGENVHTVRKRLGAQLAREAPVEADMVMPVPNCARCAAIGYSHESGTPLGRGFTTSHFVGRSFIMPEQTARDRVVQIKLRVIRDAVKGKRLVVVEDSVVRGTTTRGKMGALRKAGATEIHLRVASPPIRHGCFFGIDFPDPSRLVATNRTVDEIRDYLHVDSLYYLSLEGMLSCVCLPQEEYCTACFSGEYPVEVGQPFDKYALEHRQLRMFP